MDDQLNKQIDMQNKITDLVKERQLQLTELKQFFDPKNSKLYKEIVNVSNCLPQFDELFNKYEQRVKLENIMSISVSLSKSLDLNNSIKTILIGLKVFEEHEGFLKNLTNQNKKGFVIRNIFEKNDMNTIPLIKNDHTKTKFNNKENLGLGTNYQIAKDFYDSLFRNDGNFWNDFNKYLNFQLDLKQKTNSQFQVEDFATKLSKVMSGSLANSYKFYSRSQISFDLDFASVIGNSCDIFFMIYNKFIDKICYQPHLWDYLIKLDKHIQKYFIDQCAEDLQKLSENIAKNEIDDLMKNIDKLYN